MAKSKFVYLTVLVLLLILVIPSACVRIAAPSSQTSGSAQVSNSAQTSGNLLPEIVSLTAAQNQTYPGGTLNLQSVVTNPGKDILEFKWTSSGGEFVEQGGANNTWRAPDKYGDYEIKLTVSNGKGASTEAVSVIKVSANNPPSITSLTADPPGLQFDSNTTITCIATDSDGDALQYKWEVREGKISGVGSKVTWTSPSKNGDFTITVVVSDGKGAETTQPLVISVAAPTGVQTLNMVKSESGTVTSDGDKDTSIYKAGDDDSNIGYRAFFSYNIFPLWNMEIKQAKLKFIDGKVIGDDPWDTVTGVGGFQLKHLGYGSKLPSFNLVEGGPVQRDPSYNNKQFAEVDVTPELINDVSNRLDRSQFEAGFMKKTTNGNGVAQYIQWADVVLEITAQQK